MKELVATSLMVASLAAGAAQAQETSPTTPEIVQAVMRFEGRWQAEASLEMGGQAYAFTYLMEFRKIAADQGLIMSERADIPELGELRGENLIGHDPYEGRLHWFSVDNFGTTHDHTGELVSAEHLRLIHDSEREGKRYHETIDFLWKGADRFEAKLVGTLDGNTEEILEAAFVRAAN